MAYKMKGSPMQRNFGVGEKESPMKVAWVVPVVTAAVSAATSIKLAKDAQAAKKKKEDEQKKQDALAEASQAIGKEKGGKTRLVD